MKEFTRIMANFRMLCRVLTQDLKRGQKGRSKGVSERSSPGSRRSVCQGPEVCGGITLLRSCGRAGVALTGRVQCEKSDQESWSVFFPSKIRGKPVKSIGSGMNPTVALRSSCGV